MRPFRRKKRVLGVSQGNSSYDYSKRRCQNAHLIQHDLTPAEFQSLLGSEDILVLLESAEENARRGNFRRVFPTPERINKYSDIFDGPKFNNNLLWKYLKLKESTGVDVLEELFKDKREMCEDHAVKIQAEDML